MNLVLDAQGFPVQDGARLDLPRKERAVLAMLIRERDRVVSKQDFAEHAWNGRAMSDESLARCISRLRRLLPGMQIEAVYGHGYRLHGEPPAAHRRLLGVARAAPQAVEAHLHARTLAQRRTPDAMQRALALLRALTAEHPAYAAARVTLAEALAATASWGLSGGQGLIDEGLMHLEAAASADAQCPGIAPCRAWLLGLAWRFDEAEAEYRRALRGTEDDAETLFLYGWHRLATGDAEGALMPLQQALQLQPYSVLYRAMHARALGHAGQWSAALQAVEAVAREHPDNAIARAQLIGLRAYLAPTAANADDAWQLAQQADAPPYALSVLTYALARGGRDDEARSLIELCLACSASTACSALLHSAAYLALGETERAVSLVTDAFAARCALLPMALREPANAALLAHPQVAAVAAAVYGKAAS